MVIESINQPFKTNSPGSKVKRAMTSEAAETWYVMFHVSKLAERSSRVQSGIQDGNRPGHESMPAYRNNSLTCPFRTKAAP